MTTYSFLDDYSEGAHPQILQALTATNSVQQAPYGEDAYSHEAKAKIRSHLANPDCAIFFVASGTLANIITIGSFLRPHEAVIAAASGHIVTRETGAIEAIGHKIITVPPVNGKLTPDGIRAALEANAHFPHMAKPRLVYISNATEIGTIYSKAELQAISDLCRERKLILYMDGARLGAALSGYQNDLTLTDIGLLTDAFWIGGTKVGALLGEAIVITNPSLAEDFAFHIKQRGGLLAKGRILGLQFQELFGPTNLFFNLALHSNAMAKKLATGITNAGYELAANTETNQVFPILPNALIASLSKLFAFYVWEKRGEHNSVIRLVTSWATEEAQVDRLVEAINSETVSTNV
ncbi:low specificity L-threonine aldolase [Glaciimonas sp. PCH181]|uniref:threonine aldolase family protein n=1 Tax=Glaciimonas sp. PCH181 TaxID=2133943 RepID=UPI000D398E8E|nr:aminotransferase class I/II-fold pyridoxal phosphate-dependent enzyme [Glaciimonas sp. PCH181]PUA18681.1 threonine aldolase [Glaciimonas sp. PCH181]